MFDVEKFIVDSNDHINGLKQPALKGVWVELSPSEAFIAKQIGTWRYQNARKHGYQDQKIGLNKSNADIDINGAAAELAFCKWANLWPDLVITEGKQPDFDAVLPSGITIDVKQSSRQTNNLLIKLDKDKHPADRYVLVLGKSPRLRIVGWAGKEEAIQDGRIRDLGWGDGYFMNSEELNDIWEILK